jgi:hypothetical protein
MSNNGTASTTVTFTVDLEIDNEVWQMNYGLDDPTPKNIREDILNYMQQVIQELVERHIDSSGNEGSVHVGFKV